MTEEPLIELLQKEGGEVERLKEMTEIRQEAEKVVATVHNIQNDTSEELQARWLIGCDMRRLDKHRKLGAKTGRTGWLFIRRQKLIGLTTSRARLRLFFLLSQWGSRR